MKVEQDLTNYISSVKPRLSAGPGCRAASLPWESHVAEHVLQIRKKENNAHLLLQRPAPQPRVVLQQLLIAQAVLHRAGDVTHPECRRSAHCSSPLPSPASRRPPCYWKWERLINLLMPALDYGKASAAQGGRQAGRQAAVEGWLQIEEGISGLPWQRHPCEGRASKLERDREAETERNRDGLVAKRQIELLNRLVQHVKL